MAVSPHPGRGDTGIDARAALDAPSPFGSTPRGEPRILLIDDNPAMHDEVRTTLQPRGGPWLAPDGELGELGDREAPSPLGWPERYEIDSAYQGKQGLAQVRAAVEEQRPFAVALVDMRMPPGWDGLETVSQIRRADPQLQIVVCTDLAHHSSAEIAARLVPADGLLILRKPFDAVEVRQVVHALCERWLQRRALEQRLSDLETANQTQGRQLAEVNVQLRREILTRARLESELSLAQRLETVGQLASGMAHEGTAGIEEMTASVRSLRLAFQDLATLIDTYRRLLLRVSTVTGQEGLLDEMRRAEEAADLVGLQQEISRDFARLVDGTTPMNTLVHAVKEMARETTGEHPLVPDVGQPRATER